MLPELHWNHCRLHGTTPCFRKSTCGITCLLCRSGVKHTQNAGASAGCGTGGRQQRAQASTTQGASPSCHALQTVPDLPTTPPSHSKLRGRAPSLADLRTHLRGGVDLGSQPRVYGTAIKHAAGPYKSSGSPWQRRCEGGEAPWGTSVLWVIEQCGDAWGQRSASQRRLSPAPLPAAAVPPPPLTPMPLFSATPLPCSNQR